MPQELPGFYYDPEKNRYLPLKGPIPGSTLLPKKPPSQPNREHKICRPMKITTFKLLHDRELYGNATASKKRKCNFQEEYRKLHVSQPVVWKYQGTQRMSDGALEQACVDLVTPGGQYGTHVLLAGGVNGCLSFLEVEKAGQHFDYGTRYTSDHVWPLTRENQTGSSKALEHILRPTGNLLLMPSNISCIKMSANQSFGSTYDGYSTQRVLITTLGSETSGGSVYILNLTEPLDFNPNSPALRRRMTDVASLSCTIWTADYNPARSQAVIGTNRGAALVDLETGVSSWVCCGRSDVLSQQLDQSGNIVLCGLRNGAIVTVDVRQRQEASSARLARHRIPYATHKIHEPLTLKRYFGSSTEQWFELKGSVYPSQTICMSSSISCLVSLQHYDQYFLASSMDGLIKLYDHRQIKRGVVQSYEGNVNSHSRVQLGVDSSERFVMSGGEDGKFRLWSIKSGELLFEEKISNSVISTVCWPRTGRHMDLHGEMESDGVSPSKQNDSWNAWLGSHEGLFQMQWE